MTKDKQIAALKLDIKILCYERDFLQARLDKLRKIKDQLVLLLETPTFPEALKDAGPDATVFDLMGKSG